MTSLKELRQKCNAANKNPYIVGDDYFAGGLTNLKMFEVAANPATVLQLLDALEKAMDALEQHSDADILNPGVRPNTAGRALQELREAIGD